MPKRTSTPTATPSTQELAERGLEKRKNARLTFPYNPRSHDGLNPKRRKAIEMKKVDHRMKKMTSVRTASLIKRRGADIDILACSQMYNIVFSFYRYTSCDPACYNESRQTRGRQGPNGLHPMIAEKPIKQKATDVVRTAVVNAGYPYSWDTIWKCAKRFRERLRMSNGNVVTALGDLTCSNRDGRAPTNAIYTDPQCKVMMESANDNIGGKGSWNDLSLEYCRICKEEDRSDLEGCTTSMWNWAGLFGWTRHRRWVKPLLVRIFFQEIFLSFCDIYWTSFNTFFHN